MPANQKRTSTTLNIRRFFKKWQTLIVLLGGAAWTVLAASATAYWTLYTFRAQTEARQQARDDEIKAREQARDDAEKNAAMTRRIEAQRPFLEKKLAIYFETIQVAERLIEWELSPLSQEWKDNTKRFWQLRWGELEMVGDPGIREAARRVAQQIVETEYDPQRDRHDLRWTIECLADELRFSLEHAWGFDPLAVRFTSAGVPVSKLPHGCYEGRQEPVPLPGMLPLAAPGNSPILHSGSD